MFGNILRLHNKSIRAKLTTMMALTSLVVLLLASMAFMANDMVKIRSGMVDDLSVLANVIGRNSSAALVFDDQAAALETLAALSAEPNILGASIHRTNGEVLASYPQHGNPISPQAAGFDQSGVIPDSNAAPEYRFGTDSLDLVAPIQLDREQIGSIHIRSSLQPIEAQIHEDVMVVGAILIISIVVAFVLAAVLQSSISEPVLALAGIMQRVKSERDYSLRATWSSNDELGMLTDGFNDMLAQIRERDRELKEARDSAEQASRAKSQFLANMSHEIRTPMNGVLGMTELLLQTPLTEQQTKFCNTVHRSGKALLHVINDILDFSKVEAGKMELEALDFNLREAVEEVMELLAESAHRKGLELLMEIAPDTPLMVCGDPGRLRQILTNLVGNALKFTEHGEVFVRLGVMAQDDHEVSLQFEVRDTGIGMTDEACTRIFESFTQADGSTTRHYGGTGLGLAISRRLVEMMGGEISVATQVNQGSVFRFHVQLLSREDQVRGRREHEVLRGMRVLIVDDNDTNRAILEHQTAAWGLRHASASGGKQALAMLRIAVDRNDPYDLAILDMHMPGMDGITLARAIKADRLVADTPLIMLTSVGGFGDARRAQISGIRSYLHKPVRQSDLYNALLGAVKLPVVVAEPALVEEQHLQLGDIRLLVAEDNPVNQEVAISMLEMLGCRCDLATNGVEVLAALEHKDYDVILMDCQMPEMDGFEATAEIRRREQATSGRHVTIIAVTANAMEGDREQCLRAGMDDYLSKPFSRVQLMEMLNEWCGGHANAAPPPATAEAAAEVGNEESYSLDPGALRNIRSLQQPGRPDILGKVIDLFLADCPGVMNRLRLAIESADAEQVRQNAHRLKSGSANLGATRMAELCRELEQLGRSGALDDATTLLARVETEFRQVVAALQAERSRGAA
jgi:signal transduction histidine kinase/DNA-binding response OmpR family regulator